MAFTVTPTSGSAPYVFTAEFSAKESLFSDLYVLEVRPRTSAGSCPGPATSGSRSSGAEQSILLYDNYTVLTSVPAGSCLGTTIVIREIASDTIVSQATAQVSNLE